MKSHSKHKAVSSGSISSNDNQSKASDNTNKIEEMDQINIKSEIHSGNDEYGTNKDNSSKYIHG